MSVSPDEKYEQYTLTFLRSERELLRYIMVLLPNFTDAQDVLQETAIVLWKKFDDYDPAQPFVPWAKGFAAYEVKRHLRQAQHQGRSLDEHLVDRVLARREELASELDRQRELLHGCLEKLQPSQRKVVKSYYFDHDSVEHIAVLNGRSVQAVYKSLQRIRASLLECVRREMRREERSP